MRARYYSPEVRRFINQDVILGDIKEGQTLNRYAYVNGNPISYVDPFGLSRDKDLLTNYNHSGVHYYPNTRNVHQRCNDDVSTAVLADVSVRADMTIFFAGFLIPSEFGSSGGKTVVTSVRQGSTRIPLTTGSLQLFGNSKEVLKFTPDQQALVRIAKEAKKAGGIFEDEAEILIKWADEYNMLARGPEVHPNRNFTDPHIHVGPVDHIKVK